MSLDVLCWLSLVGARVALPIMIKLGMQFSSIVRVCGWIDTTQNGSNACVSSLLYVAFAILFPE